MNRRQFVALAAAAPFVARRAVAQAATGRRYALVTCDADARLALVDLEALRIAGFVETPPDPRAIERVGTRAVVCHTAAGVVTVVDRHRVLHALHELVEPRYVAAHPDGVHAFVTDSGSSGVVAIDTLRGTALGRAKLGGWARHVTIDRSGRVLWVGLGSAASSVAVVDVSDPRRPRLQGTVPTPFLSHDVGFAPDGRVWVTSGEQRESTIYGPGRRLERRLGADAAPQHVTFSRDRAYVTSGDDGTYRVHALSGRLLRTTAIPLGSYNVQQGSGLVLTPSLERGTLAVLDGHGRLLGVVEVSSSCHDACFAA